jgi:hypothetical protein
VLERQPDYQRIRQKSRLLGIPMVDETLVRQTADGSVRTEVVRGPNAGGTIHISFRPDGPDATFVYATVQLPLAGWKRRLEPLFALALGRLTEQTLAEDRFDLEIRGYAPPRLELVRAA